MLEKNMKEDFAFKMKLIKYLSRVIQQIAERPEGSFKLKENKIKFREYQREEGANALHAIDVTISYADLNQM